MKEATVERCLIDRCEGAGPYRKGWCVRHYQQWNRHGDPLWREKKSKVCSVDGCERKHYCRGFCSMHHQRWMKYGDPLAVKIVVGRSAEERFWEKVLKANSWECWEWQAARDKDGYGIFDTGKAHRVSYEWANGEIPDGVQILHHCDNPPCVNPQHLFAGTPLQNMQDKLQKGRAKYLKGAELSQAKLTDVKVKHIRERHAEGATLSELAKVYGVSKTEISYIVNRKTWKHI